MWIGTDKKMKGERFVPRVGTHWIPFLATLLMPALGFAQAPAAAKDATPATGQGGSGSQDARNPELDPTPYQLPTGRVGQSYSHALKGIGGSPKYTFNVAAGTLPDGLSLSDDGVIAGVPKSLGRTKFSVRLTDTQKQIAVQHYLLTIKNVEPPKQVPNLVDLATIQPALPYDHVRVYKLPASVLDKLVPPKPEPPATDDDLGDSPPEPLAFAPHDPEDLPIPLQVNQIVLLKQILTPLVGAEYPSHLLFEASLDARLSEVVRTLLKEAALKAQRPSPSPDELANITPPDWATLAKTTKAPAFDFSKPGRIPPDRLPEALLPVQLRNWLVERAAEDHPLEYHTPIKWVGGGDGVLLNEAFTGDVYGFYPFWWATGKAQTLNFSLIDRISLFALPFDDSGHLEANGNWNDAVTDFIRVARQHRTQLDITLYRDDWRFLRTMPQSRQKHAVDELVRDAYALLHTPVTDFVSRAKSKVPFFSFPLDYFDGLTLWLDEPSEADLRPLFHAFYSRLVDALIKELGQSPRRLVLNLVVPEHRMGKAGGFETETLFGFVKDAEKPLFDGGHIKLDVDYQSRTNLTIRYVVTLPEPTALSEKALRVRFENDPVLSGHDQKVFLRKIIPVISPMGSYANQVKDDIVYFGDNFGGAGFWPAPIQGESAPEDLQKALLSAFAPPGFTPPSALGRWVGENRWILRILFELLVLVAVPAVMITLWRRRLDDIPRPILWGVLGLVLVIVLVGALLLPWDPDLVTLRDGNALLLVLVSFVFLGAAVSFLKPRFEKP